MFRTTIPFTKVPAAFYCTMVSRVAKPSEHG